MAPYTMEINFKGQVTDVAYVGSARLPGDGYVTVTGRNCPATAAGSATEGAKLLKGGGQAGLFIATLFSVAGCVQNLLVWTSMSAASDGRVMVRLAFVDAQDASALPDTCYSKPETLGLTEVDNIMRRTAISKGTLYEGITGSTMSTSSTSYVAKLEHYDTTYPNATCTISVSRLHTALGARPFSGPPR